jgi:hypothetical protein
MLMDSCEDEDPLPVPDAVNVCCPPPLHGDIPVSLSEPVKFSSVPDQKGPPHGATSKIMFTSAAADWLTVHDPPPHDEAPLAVKL